MAPWRTTDPSQELDGFGDAVPRRRSSFGRAARRAERSAARSDAFGRTRESAKARLAAAVGISQGYLSRIEAGEVEPSLAVLVALADALGGRLRIRVEPGMGPVIRDHLQAAMMEALLQAIHPRWARFPEVAVHRPVRGFIDLVVADRDANLLVAVEIHSQLRRLEQQLRWANEKAEALRNLPELAPLGPTEGAPTIPRLLVLRSTRATRAIADAHQHLFAAAYPADLRAIRTALAGAAPWPGAGMVWMAVEGGRARVVDRRR